jgi:hypothetical protein
MDKGFYGVVALGGIIAIIVMMLNPLMAGWMLVKLIELAVVIAIVNFGCRVLTRKSLVELIQSLREREE